MRRRSEVLLAWALWIGLSHEVPGSNPPFPVAEDGTQYGLSSLFGPRILSQGLFDVHEGMDFGGPPFIRPGNPDALVPDINHPIDVDPVRALEQGTIDQIEFARKGPVAGALIVRVQGEHRFRYLHMFPQPCATTIQSAAGIRDADADVLVRSRNPETGLCRVHECSSG